MIFVIGDVHGEVFKLKALIKNITKKYCDNPEFIFVGDYLDKGEDVYSTLKYMQEMIEKYKVKLLYGNHEFFWWKLCDELYENQNIKQYLTLYGGMMTVKSFKVDSLFQARQKIISHFPWFFKSLVPHHFVGDFLITHSGLKPDDFYKPIDLIRLEDKIFNRYDFIKSRQLFQNKFRFIFGHTGFYSPYVDETKIGIDTAACFLEDQPLTAFCLDEGFFINSSGVQTNLKEVALNYIPCIPRNQPWRIE